MAGVEQYQRLTGKHLSQFDHLSQRQVHDENPCTDLCQRVAQRVGRGCTLGQCLFEKFELEPQHLALEPAFAYSGLGARQWPVRIAQGQTGVGTVLLVKRVIGPVQVNQRESLTGSPPGDRRSNEQCQRDGKRPAPVSDHRSIPHTAPGPRPGT